jgi:putative redox protein
MKIRTVWKQKYLLESTNEGGVSTTMDTKKPYGDETAPSPKELCLASITGCTAMDLVVYFNKYKQNLKSMRIEADAPVTKGHPAVFEKVLLDFYLEGVEEKHAMEAVKRSQTKECGVSAMIAKACPIYYRVFLEGNLIGEGKAAFDL